MECEVTTGDVVSRYRCHVSRGYDRCHVSRADRCRASNEGLLLVERGFTFRNLLRHYATNMLVHLDFWRRMASRLAAVTKEVCQRRTLHDI